MTSDPAKDALYELSLLESVFYLLPSPCCKVHKNADSVLSVVHSRSLKVICISISQKTLIKTLHIRIQQARLSHSYGLIKLALVVSSRCRMLTNATKPTTEHHKRI